MLWYILSWVIFILAVAINIGVWAIDYFAVGIQASNYYSSAYAVSTLADITTYADSTLIFATSTTSLSDPLSIAMSLVFSWVLWKLPLVIYTFNLI
jgi:hypothetical protein